ncbi:MAG: hypothetical protein M9918_24935 [Anaerolineae bacterium]|nr:hypothetical protein [Anaerolineae bacterium]MCO5191423.1 hypothetical protein [Anaerolineae bacterium]
MNPFTQFLAQFLPSHDLDVFVAYWDQLEALIIRVYKTQRVSSDDERLYVSVRAQLQKGYARWQKQLDPFWRAALVNGSSAERDPFVYLFSAESAAAFIGDWTAMQQLPAAREALNRFIVAQSADTA